MDSIPAGPPARSPLGRRAQGRAPAIRQPGTGPVALARGMWTLGLAGQAWLDTATAVSRGDAAASSLLAACPEERWRGRDDEEWRRFERELTRYGAAEPGAVVLGWVEYDGAFEFAAYPQPVFWERDAWHCPAGAPPWFEAARRAAPGPEPLPPAPPPPRLEFAPDMTAEGFCERVRRAQAHIAAGDVYQINLTHRFQAPWPAGGDPFALYLALRRVSPSPEAAFLDFPGRTVLCASPESFLRFDGRRVGSRPIKGTRPRFPCDPERDAASARELLASEKERAELLMITDLLRNDLGRVCEFGSVHVPELHRLEGFAQVFHLVSTVTGRLRPGLSPAAAMRTCLPGGSITGAPKARARQLIAELEAPTPRGLYTGVLGYFGGAVLDHRARFNIVIRTLVIEGASAHFGVGAGIVADSCPEREFEETLHKAAGILRACGAEIPMPAG